MLSFYVSVWWKFKECCINKVGISGCSLLFFVIVSTSSLYPLTVWLLWFSPDNFPQLFSILQSSIFFWTFSKINKFYIYMILAVPWMLFTFYCICPILGGGGSGAVGKAQAVPGGPCAGQGQAALFRSAAGKGHRSICRQLSGRWLLWHGHCTVSFFFRGFYFQENVYLKNFKREYRIQPGTFLLCIVSARQILFSM